MSINAAWNLKRDFEENKKADNFKKKYNIKKTKKSIWPVPEKEIQNQILDYLTAIGVFCWRQNTGAAKYTDQTGLSRYVQFGYPGISDIIGVYQGRFLAIEIKAEGKKLTLHQKTFLDQINANGGLAFLAHSVDDVIKGLKK